MKKSYKLIIFIVFLFKIVIDGFQIKSPSCKTFVIDKIRLKKFKYINQKALGVSIFAEDSSKSKNSITDDIDFSSLNSIRIPEFGTTSTADVILNIATTIGGAFGGLVLGGMFEGYATEMVGTAVASWLPVFGVIALGGGAIYTMNYLEGSPAYNISRELVGKPTLKIAINTADTVSSKVEEAKLSIYDRVEDAMSMVTEIPSAIQSQSIIVKDRLLNSINSGVDNSLQMLSAVPSKVKGSIVKVSSTIKSSATRGVLGAVDSVKALPNQVVDSFSSTAQSAGSEVSFGIRRAASGVKDGVVSAVGNILRIPSRIGGTILSPFRRSSGSPPNNNDSNNNNNSSNDDEDKEKKANEKASTIKEDNTASTKVIETKEVIPEPEVMETVLEAKPVVQSTSSTFESKQQSANIDSPKNLEPEAKSSDGMDLKSFWSSVVVERENPVVTVKKASTEPVPVVSAPTPIPVPAPKVVYTAPGIKFTKVSVKPSEETKTVDVPPASTISTISTPKVELKPEPKLELKPEPKLESKPEPKPEPKLESKPVSVTVVSQTAEVKQAPVAETVKSTVTEVVSTIKKASESVAEEVTARPVAAKAKTTSSSTTTNNSYTEPFKFGFGSIFSSESLSSTTKPLLPLKPMESTISSKVSPKIDKPQPSTKPISSTTVPKKVTSAPSSSSSSSKSSVSSPSDTNPFSFDFSSWAKSISSSSVSTSTTSTSSTSKPKSVTSSSPVIKFTAKSTVKPVASKSTTSASSTSTPSFNFFSTLTPKTVEPSPKVKPSPSSSLFSFDFGSFGKSITASSSTTKSTPPTSKPSIGSIPTVKPSSSSSSFFTPSKPVSTTSKTTTSPTTPKTATPKSSNPFSFSFPVKSSTPTPPVIEKKPSTTPFSFSFTPPKSSTKPPMKPIITTSSVTSTPSIKSNLASSIPSKPKPVVPVPPKPVSTFKPPPVKTTTYSYSSITTPKLSPESIVASAKYSPKLLSTSALTAIAKHSSNNVSKFISLAKKIDESLNQVVSDRTTPDKYYNSLISSFGSVEAAKYVYPFTYGSLPNSSSAKSKLKQYFIESKY